MAEASGLDLPDEPFDYEEYTRREFGKPGLVPRGIRPFWWAVAVFLLAGFVLFFLLR